MISINTWYKQAVDKLDAEMKTVTGKKERVMASAVLMAIKDFCRQDEEFAQAVVQGRTFADCMKVVANSAGNAISDLDAYREAVQCYFPGAKIQMKMSIDLIGDAAVPMEESKPEPKEEHKSAMILNLADFL